MENAANKCSSDAEIDVQEMLQLQVSEVEMLSSMFANPGELILDDPSCLAEIQEFLDGSVPYDYVHSRIGFTVKVNRSEDGKNIAEMVCHLPHEYPAVCPEIFVRAQSLSKAQHKQLGEDVTNFIQEQDRNELIITAIIQWLEENLESYQSAKLDADTNKKPTSTRKQDNKFSRMWIYSHHIYSKIKRKDILELTAELHLTGFTLPGKPGIIVVEGYNSEVEEFWGTIRRWQWKKLTMKEKEDYEIGAKSLEELKKFPNYVEKNFDAKAGKGRAIHMDLGMLYTFLEEKGCGHIFPLYFGVDGKSQLDED